MGQNGDVCAPLSGHCALILVSLSDGGLGSSLFSNRHVDVKHFGN
jgi:hypothetical protein